MDHDTPVLLIKLGGAFLSMRTETGATLFPRALKALLADIALIQKNYRVVLVHGGGKTLSAYSTRAGAQARFTDKGLRITDSVQMLHADRILSGQINTQLVRECATASISAVGLSAADGSLCIARRVNEHTGTTVSCNRSLVDTLHAGGFVPVICSVGMTRGGVPLNINADEVALSIACALQAKILLSVSDTPGIQLGGSIIPALTQTDIRRAVKTGEIHGGMIPKTATALQALRGGVRHIIIGTVHTRGNLTSLLEGTSGTRISHK